MAAPLPSVEVALVINPDAGAGGHQPEEIAEVFRRAGHAVRWASTDDEWELALGEPRGVIIAVGGDGTVEKVAAYLAGRAAHLAVLPLGTANNVARFLGGPASAHELAGFIASGRRSRIDLGLLSADGRRSTFVETFGAGFFADVIGAAKDQEPAAGAQASAAGARLRHDLRAYRRLADRARPVPMRVWLDEEPLEGRLIAVQAMNLPALGPRIPLAPGADAEDGRLDVLVITTDAAGALRDHIDACLDGAPPSVPPVPVRRVRRLRIDPGPAPMHADGRLLDDGIGVVEAWVKAGALGVIRP